eukprot:TRINITY_DN4495_c0_g1_i4.p1 TRINITY_DN4495_c0_g1~~TRINITY_DN4495_c0_g1_i4.p1  ORF type:complete len:417 (-),score=93.87 TRINITY_DN4495_c0_g1_i4:109-1275(-)
MFEQTVANILNQYLGQYVQDLNTDSLNIAVWSGDVVLKNLEIKKDCLDQFRLPISVIKGHVGEVKMTVPWSSLASSPVVLTFNNLFLHVVPQGEIKFNEGEEIERLQNQKMHRVHEYEMLEQVKLDESTEANSQKDSQNASYYARLYETIMANIQISFNNVHFYYEDSTSNPDSTFCTGFTVASLSAKATNSNFQPIFVNESTDFVYKLVTMTHLAWYWDSNAEPLEYETTEEMIQQFSERIARPMEPLPSQCTYLLKPVDAFMRSTINRAQTFSIPAYMMDIVVEEVAIHLGETQFEDMNYLVGYLKHYSLSGKYRRFRPEISVKEHPRAWWMFAINAIKFDIRKEHQRSSWDFIKNYRKDREKYVCPTKLNPPQTLIHFSLPPQKY